jgi:hypothetical protein
LSRPPHALTLHPPVPTTAEQAFPCLTATCPTRLRTSAPTGRRITASWCSVDWCGKPQGVKAWGPSGDPHPLDMAPPSLVRALRSRWGCDGAGRAWGRACGCYPVHTHMLLHARRHWRCVSMHSDAQLSWREKCPDMLPQSFPAPTNVQSSCFSYFVCSTCTLLGVIA